MKNLKKVLALGLALVMILGMFTIASAAETAADFTDWDKVENKDAVSLMVDLGIINGMPDGSYAPDQTIDRASWAKMLFFVLQGDANPKVYESDYPELTDIKGNWAQGQIEYLYSNEYVSGDNLGKYNPSDPISVAAAAKTMLTAIGYNSKIEGYEGVGAAWSNNVINDARENGLLDGIDQKQSENITRDNAAQMVYNALSAATKTITKTLNPITNEYVPSGEYKTGVTLGEKTFSAVPVNVAISVNGSGDVTLTPNGEENYSTTPNDLKDVAVSSTLAGEDAVVWVKINSKKQFVSVVSSTVAKSANSAAATFTDAVTIAKITGSDPDADEYVAGAATGMKIYVNGAEAACTETKRGDVVNVYTTDGKVSAIKVTTYSMVELSGDVETTTRGDDLYVYVPGVTGRVLASTVTGYQGLAEGDIVLVNEDAKHNFTIEKAEVITGEVTAKRGTTDPEMTIGGKKYTASGITGADASFTGWVVADEKGNEYNFYLDKNGSICRYEQISGEVTTEVAYVLSAGYFDSQATGLANSGSFTVEAELLFTDGTTQIVTVSKIGGKKLVDKVEDAAKEVLANDAAAEGIEGVFVDFSVDSKGKYELDDKGSLTEVTSVVEAKPVFATGLTANNKTVFLVAKGEDPEYFVYTGYANVPAMPVTAKTAALVDDSVVTYAYIVTDKFSGEGSDGLIYVADKDAYIETSAGREYDIVDADGAETTMVIDLGDATDLESDAFYTVTSITDGAATVEKYTKTTPATLSKLGAGVVQVGSNDAIAYDKATVCVVIDKDDEQKFVSAGAFSPDSFKMLDTNEYTAIVLGDGPAEYIYVIRAEKDLSGSND